MSRISQHGTLSTSARTAVLAGAILAAWAALPSPAFAAFGGSTAAALNPTPPRLAAAGPIDRQARKGSPVDVLNAPAVAIPAPSGPASRRQAAAGPIDRSARRGTPVDVLNAPAVAIPAPSGPASRRQAAAGPIDRSARRGTPVDVLNAPAVAIPAPSGPTSRRQAAAGPIDRSARRGTPVDVLNAPAVAIPASGGVDVGGAGSCTALLTGEVLEAYLFWLGVDLPTAIFYGMLTDARLLELFFGNFDLILRRYRMSNDPTGSRRSTAVSPDP